MTVDELVDDAKTRMDKSVEAMRHELTGVRTGRASAALLDRIQVDYYGTRTPLNQLAQISVPDARLLMITPYDKSAIKEIERAVLESDLGLNPANDGNVVRLPIPQLTEDRRKELVKVARHIAEEGRIARAQRAPRRAAPPQGARPRRRGAGRRGAPRRGARAEAHGRAREAHRRRAEGQGSRDPRGLGDGRPGQP